MQLSEYHARRERLGIRAPVTPAPVVIPRVREVAPPPPWVPPARTIYARPIGPPHVTSSWHTAKAIRESVAECHGFTVKQLCSAQRKAALVAARHEAMYLISKNTLWSLPQIGRFFGGRDHSSIIHAIRRHQARIDAGTVGP